MTSSVKIATIAFVFIVGWLQGKAQYRISRSVKTPEGISVDFVSVVASPNAHKTILSSAFTDENCKFKMSVKSECDSIVLKASSVEIAPAQITVPKRTGSYEIIVENRAVVFIIDRKYTIFLPISKYFRDFSFI